MTRTTPQGPALLEQRRPPRRDRVVGTVALLLLAAFWAWVASTVPFVLSLPRGWYPVSRLLLPAVISVLFGSHALGYMLRSPSRLQARGVSFGLPFGRFCDSPFLAWSEVRHVEYQFYYGALVLMPYPRTGKPLHTATFEGEGLPALARVEEIAASHSIGLSEFPNKRRRLEPRRARLDAFPSR